MRMVCGVVLVVLVSATGVHVAAEEAAAKDALVDANAAATAPVCLGTSTTKVLARESDPVLLPGVSLPDDPEAQPTGGGSWPDCAPEISCGGHPCHPSATGCQVIDTGVQFCGWDGGISPPEFGCPKNQTIHVSSCPCLPAESLCNSSNQTKFCQ